LAAGCLAEALAGLSELFLSSSPFSSAVLRDFRPAAA
jgi:hypothetical protein